MGLRRPFVAVAMSLLLLSGAAQSAQAGSPGSQQPRGTSATAGDPYRAAMEAAAKGDTRALERLLASPTEGAAMRTAVAKWLKAHPTLAVGQLKPLSNTLKAPSVMATGQYDITCQYYDGSFHGWYGQPFLACHGYLDKYISGSHASHSIPDLFPRGRVISIDCAKAVGAGGLLALGTLTSAPTGPLGWAAVGASWTWVIADVTVNCRHL